MAKRITLQDQWDGMLAELEAKKAAYLAPILEEHPIPALVYKLESYKYIAEYQVDQVTVYVSLPWINKRPTRESVAKLRAIVDGFKPEFKDVRVCYKYDASYGHVSGAVSLTDFLSGEHYATTREALLPKQAELIEKYAPREGYTPCKYCGTQKPTAEMVSCKVIARQYPNMEMTALYCDKACGTYNQMAHEG